MTAIIGVDAPRILIVEEDAGVSDDLQARLHKLGYTVCEVVTTGEMALAAIEAELPNLVLMNITLNGQVDGIQTAQTIRDKWGIPVVFLTDYTVEDQLQRAMPAYPFGYLLKPILNRDIKVTVEMALYVSQVEAERRAAETALKVSEERMALALAGAGLGYWDWNLQTGENIFNKRWAEMLGYEMDEIAPQVGAWEKLIHPDDLPMVRDRMNAHLRGERDNIDTEYRMRHKSGRFIWVLDKGQVIERDLAGNPVRVCGTHLDITERKNADEEWRILIRMLDEAPSLIAIHDFEGNFLYINRRAHEMHGYFRDEMMALSVSQLDRPEGGAIMASHLQALKEAGSLSFEVLHRRKDGTLLPLYVNSRVVNWGSQPVVLVVADDITERKLAEEAVRESQEIVRNKLKAILEPDGDIGTLELADILNHEAVKSIMEDFYGFAKLGTSIVDLKGRVLVSVGWEEICQNFHRVHPQTSQHCLASDTDLTRRTDGSELVLYKCQNNMWDMAIPIRVGGKHVGNLFSGQFFFEDEQIDYEVFRAQAQKYGFDEPEYMAALEKVPRWPRDAARKVMKFIANFAALISHLSYSNIKLARMFSEKDRLLRALRKSEDNARVLVESSVEAIFVVQDGMLKFVNPRTEEISGYTREELLTTPCLNFVQPEERQLFGDWPAMIEQGLEPPTTISFRVMHKTGRLVWVELKWVMIEWEGRPAALSFMDDISQRKLVELELKKARNELEDRVRQRTSELNTLNDRLLSEIEERKRIEAELISQQSCLNRLSSELLLTEERERRSLATLLHDDIGQQLALTKIQLKTLINGAPSPTLTEPLEQICDNIDGMIRATRSLTMELSPPILYELGLKEAIEWLAELMESNYSIRTRVFHEQRLHYLEDDIKILLFRAVRELLVNVVKHAQADQITVTLTADEEYAQINVRDDGIGFPQNISLERIHFAGGYGLLNIHERLASLGGWMVIDSEPGQGASVTLVVPRKETLVNFPP